MCVFEYESRYTLASVTSAPSPHTHSGSAEEAVARRSERSQHLILYWCPQTFPLPWHTSWSRLQQQETLQMSTSLRTGKHRMCSSSSVGRSVSFFVWGSEVMPFTSGCPSPATDVAIFTVYPITSCLSPASLWRRGQGVGKGGRSALLCDWLLGQKGRGDCVGFAYIVILNTSRFKRHTFVKCNVFRHSKGKHTK